MRRVFRLAAAAVVGAACGVAFAVVGPVPAYASACDATTSGVTVVVDFSGVGGGIDVRCSPGDPTDGVVALRGAGFGVTGTQRWGDAFVCRIDGLPTAASEACVNTPPAQAYWSYWHAPRGGGWTYSTVGARAYDPSPGWVEGWSFGSGQPPGVPPPAAPAADPPPPPPPAEPANPPPPQPVNPAPVNPPPANGNEGPPGGVNPGNPPADSGAPGDPSAPSAGDPSATPPPVGAAPYRSPAGSQRPSPSTVDSLAVAAGWSIVELTGTLVGVALVLGLAAVATIIAIRRRRVQS